MSYSSMVSNLPLSLTALILVSISTIQPAPARASPVSKNSVLGDKPLYRGESLSERFTMERERERAKQERTKKGHPPHIIL